jgi:hypothetical protein
MMAAQLTGKIPDLRREQPSVAAESADLVRAMMALEPGDRPASYSEIIERIDRLPRLEPSSAPGSWVPPAETLRAAPHAAETAAMPLAATVAMPSARRSSGRRVAIVSGLAIATVLVVIGLPWLAFRQPPIERDLVPTGRGQYLFDGQQIDQWLPLSGGWFPRTDEEGGLVLEGAGDVRRAIAIRGPDGVPVPLDFYRLTLFVYLRESSAVEVQFDLASRDRDATRQVVRVTAEGSSLGRRAGERAALQTTSPLVSLPVAADRPHVVQIERHSAGWWILVDEQLVGAVRGTTAQPADEFRIRVDGSAAWISDVVVEELGPAAASK